MRRFLILILATLATMAMALPVLAGGNGGCDREFSDSSTDRVKLIDNCFLSDVARIDVGQTVTWTNADGWDHNIFSRAFQGTVSLGAGSEYAAAFDTTGVFSYFCTIHPGMMGVIVVGDSLSTDEAALSSPNPPNDMQGGQPFNWMASLALLGGGLGLGALTQRTRNRSDGMTIDSVSHAGQPKP